jgi:hypothetical protein
MKPAHPAVQTPTPTSEDATDLYQDETLAMVYVGDVYSLVVQSGTTLAVEPNREADDDGDTLLPFIR